VLLHDGLAISPQMTVGGARALVRAQAKLPLRTRSIRLFVGHGGTELDDDALLVADSALATDDALPLVVFPTLCTLRRTISVWPPLPFPSTNRWHSFLFYYVWVSTVFQGKMRTSLTRLMRYAPAKTTMAELHC